MPYEVRARPYSETSAACAAAVAFDDAPRVLTPTQFDDDDEEEEEEEDDSRDGAAKPPQARAFSTSLSAGLDEAEQTQARALLGTKRRENGPRRGIWAG